MATADRVLSVLALFTMDQPEWTVEAAAAELDLSASTAYQYFRSLVDAGMLVGANAGRYAIGPAVIAFDRLARRTDRLVRASEKAMIDLAEEIPEEAVVLLCRSFRWQVMCVAQHAVRPPDFAISYERGRLMPMVRGSASKAVLAALPPRQLRRFYADHAAEAAVAGLGEGWDEFKAIVRAIRKANVVVAHGEIDPDALGVSAPVADIDGAIGSIGVVVSASRVAHDASRLAHLRSAVSSAAEDVAAELRK